MPTQSKAAAPPSGLTRLFYRAPILFYRVGLGFILGDRFLLLTHTGRKSGLPRKVVLEVVQHDKDRGSYYIAAGFGPRSDWYQNLLKTPAAEIHVGRRRMAVQAKPCEASEARQVLGAYAAEHPRAAKNLAGLMGYQTDGSVEDFAALGDTLKVVRLDPR